MVGIGQARAVAIAAPDHEGMTYGDLRTQVENGVLALRRLGIKRGDRVALVLPNGPLLASTFVVATIAGVAAPLNPGYQEKEFDFFLGDLEAKLLVVSAGEDSPARRAAERLRIPIADVTSSGAIAGKFDLTGQLAGRPADSTDYPEPADTALLLHTSGTTSRPKMVPLTHRNLCASAEHITNWLSLGSEDKCMNIMPLFHIHGLVAAVLSTLRSGGTVCCTSGFNALRVFRWLDEIRPTWFTAVPTMLHAISERAGKHGEEVKKGKLRFIRSSSASLSPQLMRRLGETFGVPVVESYGMTEAAHQMASNPLPPGEQKAGTVGLPAGPRIAIMDERGRLLSEGHVGEVVIKGPNVTPGYLGNPQANEAAFSGGWFRTGDQGVMGADGYLRLTGRLKELINRGGEKISPREVEEVLLDHPAVDQVVAFGLPHEKLGEDIGAAIVLRDSASATENEIRSFAAEKLAAFKIPRRIIFLKEIPKGPTGKLQRIGLAERLNLR